MTLVDINTKREVIVSIDRCTTSIEVALCTLLVSSLYFPLVAGWDVYEWRGKPR